MDTLKAIDFFCGAGGVTYGFKKAGIEVLGGIDIDCCCMDTYEKNNDAIFLNIDISNLDKKFLGQKFNITIEQDNLVFAGCSPCQYYSNIQTNKIKSTKTRLLLADFQEFVDYYKPGYVFIENVPGIEKKTDSPLSRFKDFLIKSGYNYDDSVINAKYYDVPQNRRRYVLIASRINNIKLPIPEKKNIRTVRDALKKFKKIEAGHVDKTHYLHSTANLSELNLIRIKRTNSDGGDRRTWENDPELQLDCYKTHNGHHDVYGRMHWDKPSPTITTKFISISNGRFGHPEQNRAISLREGATLQSFPKKYIFYSPYQGTIARMIGNAVPPKLAEKIGRSIIASYKKFVND